jgi:hypothetical protein
MKVKTVMVNNANDINNIFHYKSFNTNKTTCGERKPPSCLYISALCRVYTSEICIYWLTWTLENTEDAIINGQSRDNDNTCHIRRRKTKHKAKCVGHHNAQANTNNVNKTLALLQITEDKDVQRIVFFAAIVIYITTQISERKDT